MFVYVCVSQLLAPYCAVVMEITAGGAVTATAAGRGQSVTFQSLSVWTISARVMACVFLDRVRVTVDTKATAVTWVREYIHQRSYIDL